MLKFPQSLADFAGSFSFTPIFFANSCSLSSVPHQRGFRGQPAGVALSAMVFLKTFFFNLNLKLLLLELLTSHRLTFSCCPSTTVFHPCLSILYWQSIPKADPVLGTFSIFWWLLIVYGFTKMLLPYFTRCS